MKADHHFWIGKTHKVCEDYALSGVKEDGVSGDVTYAIVSDGCSSSPNTDIGARILARAATENLFKAHRGLEVFSEAVMAKADSQRLSLGLERSALDATLLVAVNWDGRRRASVFGRSVSEVHQRTDIFMMGDGVICIKAKDHREVIRAEYPLNMPYYPSYLLNEANKSLFNKNLYEFVDNRGHNIYTANFEGTSMKGTITSDISSKVLHPSREDFPWLHKRYDNKLGDDYLEYVALMSDGVESFQRTVQSDTSITSESIHYTEIVDELLGFKKTNGEFVKRRAGRAMKTYAKEGVFHNDDVSIAVLHRD